jgi:hypothetical protein
MFSHLKFVRLNNIQHKKFNIHNIPINKKTGAYKTIILPVALYGCETWSLTLREEQRLRVFGNTMLRRIFGPKRYEATGERRRLHNEELKDLYSSPNVFGVIKLRRMRWAGHEERMGKREVHTGFWWADLKEGDHLGDPGVDGRRVVKWIFKSGTGGAWTGLSWLRIGRGGGLL